MGNKCKVKKCRINDQNHESGTVFRLPKDPAVREGGYNFWTEKMLINSKLCLFVKKHFEEKYLNRNESRTRLKKASTKR